jgi:hypothetical protein
MLFASPTAALAATFLVSFLSFHSVSARPTDRFAVRESNTKAATLATDGKSAIVDLTTTIKNVPLRFKVSAPPEQYLVPGNTAAAAGNSSALPGLNVLLHGDGGQSFIDFPNQALQGNLMGVVVLAPNKNRFWGGGSGLQRTDGALHSELVNSLIKDVLPTMLAFDQNNVQFTGVSGGSLLLSGFFLPAFASQYTPTNVLLNCGGLAPQVTFVDAAKAAPNLRIHYQSTKNELTLLKGSIPTAIQAYEKAATSAGVTAADLNIFRRQMQRRTEVIVNSMAKTLFLASNSCPTRSMLSSKEMVKSLVLEV